MHIIKKMAERISEELEDAKTYAEDYIEAKAKGNMSVANKYKEMSSDELRHAEIIHGFAVAEIESVAKVYTAPVEMQEKWDKLHKEYVQTAALVRQMLSM
jgi:hypothetical protein